jgi:hypothetical protein
MYDFQIPSRNHIVECVIVVNNFTPKADIHRSGIREQSRYGNLGYGDVSVGAIRFNDTVLLSISMSLHYHNLLMNTASLLLRICT